MFLPSRARLTSRCPATPHARKLENPVIPTLLARGTRHAILVQCVEEVVYRRRVGKRFYRFLLRRRFHTAMVMKRHAGSLVGTGEIPPIPDQIAAEQRTVKVCHKRTNAVPHGGASSSDRRRNPPQDVPENAGLHLKRSRAVVLVVSRSHHDNEIEFRDDADRLSTSTKRAIPVDLTAIGQRPPEKP